MYDLEKWLLSTLCFKEKISFEGSDERKTLQRFDHIPSGAQKENKGCLLCL